MTRTQDARPFDVLKAIRYIWFFPPTAVAVGIALLSTLFAAPVQVKWIDHFDKLEHAFAYMVLSFTCMLALHKAGKDSIKVRWVVVLMAATYGILMECIQYFFLAHRTFEWQDMLANAIGSFIGMGGFYGWIKYTR